MKSGLIFSQMIMMKKYRYLLWIADLLMVGRMLMAAFAKGKVVRNWQLGFSTSLFWLALIALVALNITYLIDNEHDVVTTKGLPQLSLLVVLLLASTWLVQPQRMIYRDTLQRVSVSAALKAMQRYSRQSKTGATDYHSPIYFYVQDRQTAKITSQLSDLSIADARIEACNLTSTTSAKTNQQIRSIKKLAGIKSAHAIVYFTKGERTEFDTINHLQYVETMTQVIKYQREFR